MIILSKLALRNRAVTVMALALILVGGVYAYQQLQQELFPEISLGVINISTSFQQGTPYQVAQEVTKPIEDVIIGMEDLKEVTSTSRGSRSTVRASFETNADLEAAEAEINSRVSALRLPDAAGDPRVFRAQSQPATRHGAEHIGPARRAGTAPHRGASDRAATADHSRRVRGGHRGRRFRAGFRHR